MVRVSRFVGDAASSTPVLPGLPRRKLAPEEKPKLPGFGPSDPPFTSICGAVLAPRPFVAVFFFVVVSLVAAVPDAFLTLVLPVAAAFAGRLDCLGAALATFSAPPWRGCSCGPSISGQKRSWLRSS